MQYKARKFLSGFMNLNQGETVMYEITYSMLNAELLCLKLPELKSAIIEEDEYLGQNLPHSLFGNILNPTVTRLIKDERCEKKLLTKIFCFYEELAKYGDDDVVDLLQVTLLEYLWDDYITYSESVKLMGEFTRDINDRIASYLIKPQHRT